MVEAPVSLRGIVEFELRAGAANYFIRGPRTISTAPAISNAPAATGGTLAFSGLSTVAVTGPILAISSRLWYAKFGC